MRRFMSAERLQIVLTAAMVFLASSTIGSFAAEDAKFAFVTLPSVNVLYRIDKQTGQVDACYYQPATDEAQVGSTQCYPSGDGATPQGPGRYDLMALPDSEGGAVFRVNSETGDISICWEADGKVVCTAAAQ